MVKLSKKALEEIQAELGTVDESWQEEFNLRQTISECFDLIKRAREFNVTWEKIAEVIRKKSGVSEGISPASVSKYYLELAKDSETQKKKKRKTGVSKRKETEQTREKDSEHDESPVVEERSLAVEKSSSLTPTQSETLASESRKKLKSRFGSGESALSNQFYISTEKPHDKTRKG